MNEEKLMFKRLRGIGGNVIVLEEAAFIDESTVKNVVMPILQKKGNLFISISSLKEGSGLFSRMMKAVDFIQVKEISYVCDPCQAAGVRKICPHRLATLPPWISEENEFSKFLFGDDEDIDREQMGVLVNNGKNCFPAHLIQSFIGWPRLRLVEPVRCIFMAVDPCTGSENKLKALSDFAVVTICEPYTTIIGLEAVDVVRKEDYVPILIKHIQKIRSMEWFENATIILDVEGNNAMEAGNVQELVRKCGNVICLDDGDRKPGTITTQASKEEMVDLFNIVLQAENFRIFEKLVTSDPNPAGLVQKLEDQLINMERHIVAHPGVEKKAKHIISGKGERKNKKDDLALTLMRVIRSKHRYYFDEKFKRLR